MLATLDLDSGSYRLVDLTATFGDDLARMPHVLRILAENMLRNAVVEDRSAAIDTFRSWLADGTGDAEITFVPGRVMMHDTTCGPALVDIAGMRDALAEAGADPASLNPVLPVDVSVDHSVAVDHYASPSALAQNMERELERNAERYRLMKWATASLSGVRVHPPGTGIMHTINLEQLATVVAVEDRRGERWAVPDTLIGTDSHTPMVNGIGVLGWGVGGLEAESVLFGVPATLRVPDVIGVRLTGSLSEGVLSTDLALIVTDRLRALGVAGEFVEFFGPGVTALTAGDRAVVANMAPEYGASTGFFPIDGQTLRYLAATGRPAELVSRVEAVARRQGLWFDPEAAPRFTKSIEIDLDTLEPTVAGPRRPQDGIRPAGMRNAVEAAIGRPLRRRGDAQEIPDGAVAIAAITSCTNTTDPRLLVAAGLVARKARRLGLRSKPWVKTSLAPGSPSAARYLKRAGLLDDLVALGFDIVGFGCTTCIGNSGPLPAAMSAAVAQGTATVAVLSGNRNFPGRVHPALDLAFLASPPLVVAFALAGDVARDIRSDPIATIPDGSTVTLSDLWPTAAEIDAVLASAISPSDVQEAFGVAAANERWVALEAPATARFPWDPASTYLRRPPFASSAGGSRLGRYVAEPIMVLGDDITTDHISPAGQIAVDSEAGRWLIEHGADPADLNVYAAHRGNWEVLLRGLFNNRSARNLLAPDLPPGWTVHAPSGTPMPAWRAAQRYQDEGIPTVVVAGERYGTGSSRDWAAKGVALLGVRAVIASSFERIHRSNLVGMGILPLRLPAGCHPADLNLRPGDRIEVAAGPKDLGPRADVDVGIVRRTGHRETLRTVAAIDTALEIELLQAGGIIPWILQSAVPATVEGP